MAILHQVTALANPTEFSFACWFQMPIGITSTSLIKFGARQNPPATDLSFDGFNDGSQINISSTLLSALFRGPHVAVGDDAYTQTVVVDLPSAISSGSWHFAFVSIKVSPAFGWGLPTGIDYIPQQYSLALDAATTAGMQLPNATSGGQIIDDTDSNGLSFKNFQIGIPVSKIENDYLALFDTYSNDPVRLAYLQAWFGRYIDISQPGNYSKFVSISGGKGRPVNPSIAAAAFGIPSLLFYGSSKSFFQNRGSAGAFTKIGTINDFTPGPSFG